jgi:hypothetical protein
MALDAGRFGKRRSDRFAIISQTTFATPWQFFGGDAAQAAAGTRNFSFRLSNTHSTRAFLLASATAAMFAPHRSRSAVTQTLRRSRLRTA